MDGMISIRDLSYLILFLLAACVGVFLIIVLNNVNKFLKRINNLVDDNKANIDKTIAVIPEAAENLNSAVISIKGTSDRAGDIIENLGGTVSEAAATVEDTTEDIIDVIRSVVHVAKAVVAIFSKE